MVLEAIDYGGLGLGFGGSSVLGAAFGFAAKRIASALAIVLGVELAAFRLLEAHGILYVDREALADHLATIAANAPVGESPSWMLPALSTVSLGSGFVAGFLIGYRRG